MTRQKLWFTKIMAMCLSLALVFAIAVPASAAVPDNKQGTIVVQGLETDKGATVNLYKIIDVNFDTTNQQPEEPVYTWINDPELINWLQTTYPQYIDIQNGNAVTKTFSDMTAKEKSDFYKAFQTALPSFDLSVAKTGTFAEPDYQLQFTDVEMGQYVVIVDDSTVADKHTHSPAIANLVPVFNDRTQAWDLNAVTVNLKGSGSSIGKDVSDPDDETVAIGDEVGYRLNVVMPNYPEGSTAKRFEVGDTLSKGLTLNASSIVVKVGGTDPNTATVVNNASNTYYTITNEDKDSNPDTTNFQVIFNYAQLVEDYTGTHVYVEYNATVNEYAFETDALGNAAYVGFNTNPYDDSSFDTEEIEKDVYTYGVDVLKTDENGSALPGAEFRLYSDSALRNEIKFVKVNDGVYRIAKADEQGVALSVAANGKLQLQGLDLGTYYLKETKAPKGYNLLKNAVEVTLSDNNKDGVLDNDTDNILNQITIQNTKGFSLPITGGMGTVVFTAVGIMLMAGGIFLIVVLRRKSTQK